MLSYAEMNDLLNNVDKKSLMKDNYTLSSKKFNIVGDLISRFVLLSKINIISKDDKKNEEKHFAKIDELLDFVSKRNEYTYSFELYKQKEFIKKSIEKQTNISLVSNKLSSSDKLEIEAVINKKADKLVKETYLYYVEHCKKQLSHISEENYNFLFSETIEDYFNMPEKLEKFKKEEEQRIKENIEKSVEEEIIHEELSDTVKTEECIVEEKPKKKSFFAKIFNRK